MPPKTDHRPVTWPRTAEEVPLELKRELARHRNKHRVSLTEFYFAEVSTEDPSSSLAEPSLKIKSLHVKYAPDINCSHHPPASAVGIVVNTVPDPTT